MNAILLAAGYGTRLKPITNSTPKCLVKIKNEPLLNIWLDKLTKAGIENILINTHYLSKQVENYVDKSLFKKKIKLVKENKLLGTAGTLINNIDFFNNEDGFLIHSDNYCLEDLNNLIEAHKKRPTNCLMTMLTYQTSNPSSCGIVKINEKGIVKNFYEKSIKNYGSLANGAVYILSSQIIKTIQNKFPYAKDFTKDILQNFLGKIYTYETINFFTDIGTPKEYEKAKNF